MTDIYVYHTINYENYMKNRNLQRWISENSNYNLFIDDKTSFFFIYNKKNLDFLDTDNIFGFGLYNQNTLYSPIINKKYDKEKYFTTFFYTLLSKFEEYTSYSKNTRVIINMDEYFFSEILSICFSKNFISPAFFTINEKKVIELSKSYDMNMQKYEIEDTVKFSEIMNDRYKRYMKELNKNLLKVYVKFDTDTINLLNTLVYSSSEVYNPYKKDKSYTFPNNMNEFGGSFNIYNIEYEEDGSIVLYLTIGKLKKGDKSSDEINTSHIERKYNKYFYKEEDYTNVINDLIVGQDEDIDFEEIYSFEFHTHPYSPKNYSYPFSISDYVSYLENIHKNKLNMAFVADHAGIYYFSVKELNYVEKLNNYMDNDFINDVKNKSEEISVYIQNIKKKIKSMQLEIYKLSKFSIHEKFDIDYFYEKDNIYNINRIEWMMNKYRKYKNTERYEIFVKLLDNYKNNKVEYINLEKTFINDFYKDTIEYNDKVIASNNYNIKFCEKLVILFTDIMGEIQSFLLENIKSYKKLDIHDKKEVILDYCSELEDSIYKILSMLKNVIIDKNFNIFHLDIDKSIYSPYLFKKSKKEYFKHIKVFNLLMKNWHYVVNMFLPSIYKELYDIGLVTWNILPHKSIKLMYHPDKFGIFLPKYEYYTNEDILIHEGMNIEEAEKDRKYRRFFIEELDENKERSFYETDDEEIM